MYLRLLIILILSAALVCSCSDGGAVMVLDEAEALMSERPDSALSLLEREEDMEGRLSSFAYNRYLLLKTEAMDKTYRSLADVEYMPAVCDHYDFWGTPMERALAYYMLGGVFRDKGDAPRALTYYKDAVKQLPDSCSIPEHKLLSRIYGQMADLFHKQRYPQQELKMGIEASIHAERAGDTIMSIDAYCKTSGAYWTLNKADSAMYIVRQAYDLFRSIGYDDYAAALRGHYVKYYLDKDSLDKAKAAIDEYVSKSRLMQPDGRHTRKSNVIFNVYLGRYYEKLHETDSAIYYYRELIRRANTMNHLENAYRGLMSVYKQLGKSDSVMKYAELFAFANDTACIIASAEEISRTNALYDYSESQQIALEKTKEASFLWKVVSIIAICTFFLSVVLYKYWRLYKRRKKSLQEINAQYYDALMLYEKALTERQSMQTDYATAMDAKNHEIDRLKTQLSAYQDNFNPEEWDVEQGLMQHDIVKRFHKHAAKATVPSNSEWKDLLEISNKLAPDFHEKLSAYPDLLTPVEYNVCVLIRLRFIPSEISILVNLSKQRVSNIRAAINKKLFRKDGSKGIDAQIRRM